jgi:ribonuclease P protein component
MLAKNNRLNLRFHRDRLDKQGKVTHSPYFIVISAKRENISSEVTGTGSSDGDILPNSRFAILISKKLAKRAVDRNRLKRQMSEIVRLNLKLIPTGKDFLIIPKKKTLEDSSWKEALLSMLK